MQSFLQNTAVSATAFGTIALDIAKPIKSYDFSIDANASADGDLFHVNKEGRVTSAKYSSGAVVRILENCMIVRSEDCSLWFADRQKQFHPID